MRSDHLSTAARALSSAGHWLSKAAKETESRDEWDEIELLRARVDGLHMEVLRAQRVRSEAA